MEFPIFNSKALSVGKSYDLVDPVERQKYFRAKLGDKIERVKEYLDTGSFVGYMIAKKQGGKGTHAKMIEEILGADRFAHISVGDVVRDAHVMLEDPNKKDAYLKLVAKHYRGFTSLDVAVEALLSRSQDRVSVPTELILALLKVEIDKIGKKALFIDGLPRSLDQVSYSLYFRELINYRADPDFFVLIDVAKSIIDARMKNRVVCPICHTSRSMLSSPTKFVGFDSDSKQYYLLCDNSACSGFNHAKLVVKDGDAMGVESLEARMKTDEELLRLACDLHGIPKIYVRSTVPVNQTHANFEDFEIQQVFKFSGTGGVGSVNISMEPWTVKDDAGVESNAFHPAVFTVSIFSQIYDILFNGSE